MPDDLPAALEEIREMTAAANTLLPGLDPERALAAGVLHGNALKALAAVDAVLKVADDALPVNRDYGGEPIWWSITPGEIRSAVLAALTGEGKQ